MGACLGFGKYPLCKHYFASVVDTGLTQNECLNSGRLQKPRHLCMYMGPQLTKIIIIIYNSIHLWGRYHREASSQFITLKESDLPS